MAKDTFSVNPVTGMATVYAKKDNKAHVVHPIDAREILQSSDDYSPQPTKTINDTSKPNDNDMQVTVSVPKHTRDSIEKMNKRELTNLANTLGVDIPLTLTSLQIKDIVFEKLDL